MLSFAAANTDVVCVLTISSARSRFPGTAAGVLHIHTHDLSCHPQTCEVPSSIHTYLSVYLGVCSLGIKCVSPSNWLDCSAGCVPACLGLQAGNGIAWSSAAWVIICESQSLAVRPAAVALCMAAANLASSVVESKLLCLLKLMYYFLVLVVSVFALVGGALACSLCAHVCMCMSSLVAVACLCLEYPPRDLERKAVCVCLLGGSSDAAVVSRLVLRTQAISAQ